MSLSETVDDMQSHEDPTSPPVAVTRGRPRSKRTDQAILRATLELLAERQLSDISMDEVAARAGVSKASLYRRWPSKGTLAFDAFMVAFLDRQPLPDTGNLQKDLLAALRAWSRTVRDDTTGRTLRGLIAEVQRDPDLADAWRERFVEPVRHRHRQMVQRAIDRGELSSKANIDVLLDLLYGPAYHRLLQGHLPVDEPFVRRVVKAIMAAARNDAI
jgi:AcrR family transcriptional regulator